MLKIYCFFTFLMFVSFTKLYTQSVINLPDWTFIQGYENETLKSFSMPDFSVGESIVLPHRLTIPNRVFWYHCRVNMQGSGFIKINADDGAQLWINGQNIPADHEGLYRFSGITKQADVVVRVLNNAMAGGLRHAEIIQSKVSAPIPCGKTMDSLSFTFWGDSQGGWDTFARIINHIQSFNDPLTIGLGDLTADGSKMSQWISLGKNLQSLHSSTQCLMIAGNHDYDGYYDDLIPTGYLTFYPKENNQTYYFEKICNAAFLALDINGNFPLHIDKNQRRFIDSVCTVQAWTQADWRFILVHQPPYGQGWKGYSGEEEVRNWLESVAKTYRIDVVLSGHIHDYERITKNFEGQTTTCIVAGGGGGHLEPEESNDFPVMDKIIKKHHFGRIILTKEKLSCSVYDTEGQVIDSFIIQK
jgi:predicted phosphodiesterase